VATPSPRDIPILSDALIAEAMRRACAERFPDDPHHYETFPRSDVEALATLNPSGFCGIGWIASGWYQACFDVWLHVDTAQLHFCPVDRLSKRDPETLAFRQRVTKTAIAAALECARETFGADAKLSVEGVSGRPWEETVRSLRGGYCVVGSVLCGKRGSTNRDSVAIWLNVYTGDVAYGSRGANDQAPRLK
jgi:hypothetical protein